MTPPPSLVSALRRLLRPLVRLLTARGVTYPMLAELLKQTYVDVAAGHFGLDGEPPTDSRVSLLTGVHRKDVKRLRTREARAPDAMPQLLALGAQLAAAWTTRRDLRDRRGRPKPLPRLASEGGARSFEGVVASISKDIRARVVLDEWLRLGVAELDDQDRVVLRASGFIPARGFEEKAFYFAENLHDHIAAAAHNLDAGSPPFLERSAHYEGLTVSSVALLAALAEKTGMEAVRAVYAKAKECEARDRRVDDPKHRMRFGIYFYSERAAPDEATQKAKP